MSALGQKRTCAAHKPMSALPLKRTFSPSKTTARRCSSTATTDKVVGMSPGCARCSDTRRGDQRKAKQCDRRNIWPMFARKPVGLRSPYKKTFITFDGKQISCHLGGTPRSIFNRKCSFVVGLGSDFLHPASQ